MVNKYREKSMFEFNDDHSAIKQELVFGEECEKNLSKDGKDGKDDISNMGGLQHGGHMYLSIE